MKDNKRKGNIAELAFMHRAASLGFTVSKVLGDYSRYDVLVEKDGHTSRVQVKYVGNLCFMSHRVNLTASRRRYTWNETDFIAVYIAREDLWYILPPRAVAGITGVSLPGPASRKFLPTAWPNIAKLGTCSSLPLETRASAESITAAKAQFSGGPAAGLKARPYETRGTAEAMLSYGAAGASRDARALDSL